MDRHGHVAFARSYPVTTHRQGPICEQDPLEWRTSLEKILAEAGPLNSQIEAIVATGTLSGLVCLDANGAPLRPAIMYGDQRAHPQAQRIQSEYAAHTAGWRVHSGDFLPQLLAIAEQSPDIYRQSAHVLDATGYLNFLLTGRPTMDAFTRFHCYAAPNESGLPVELFHALGLDPGKVGAITAIGDKLPATRPVIAASFDSVCAYLGAGLQNPGDALDISGTVTSFGVLHPHQVIDPARRVYSLPWANQWLVRGSTATSGGVLEWARREIVHGDFTRFDQLVQESPPGANGVLFLPYLAGERAPIWREGATGTFFGLTVNTTQADLARAVYEGLCYALRHIQTVIAGCGVPIGAVRLAGGLSRNGTFNQMKADITGKELFPLEDPELTTRGCVAIAGVSLGWYYDLAHAQKTLLTVGKPIVPEQNPAYEAAFDRYLALTEALMPLF